MAVYVEARRHVPSGFCYVSYVWQFRVCGGVCLYRSSKVRSENPSGSNSSSL